jgi:hypothetical protein
VLELYIKKKRETRRSPSSSRKSPSNLTLAPISSFLHSCRSPTYHSNPGEFTAAATDEGSLSSPAISKTTFFPAYSFRRVQGSPPSCILPVSPFYCWDFRYLYRWWPDLTLFLSFSLPIGTVRQFFFRHRVAVRRALLSSFHSSGMCYINVMPGAWVVFKPQLNLFSFFFAISFKTQLLSPPSCSSGEIQLFPADWSASSPSFGKSFSLQPYHSTLWNLVDQILYASLVPLSLV